MKNFYLFILFLIAVKACSRHEVDFIRNPKTDGRYLRSDLIDKKEKTNTDILKVTIKSSKEELEFGIDEDCPKPFIQTAYREAETTISCKYPKENRSGIKVFCKENNLICENIQSQTSSQRSDGTFVVSETSSSFNVSIRNVSSEHAGTYWCGVEQRNRAHLKKIKLEVEDITYFTKSPTVGQNVTYWCKYDKDYSDFQKFICKGGDPNTCERLVSTTKFYMKERFSMNENKENQNITITVREVKAGDTGMYWCGAERTGKSPKFFHRMFMDVVSPATSTVAPESHASPTSPTHGPSLQTSTVSAQTHASPTSPTHGPSLQTSTVSAQTHGGVGLMTYVIIGAVVATLLLTAFIFSYKRFKHSRNRSRESEQHPKEDYVHAEMEECLQTPNSTTTSDVRANVPTNEPTSSHYSTINFQNHSADAETLHHLNPNSSPCLYSTLSFSQNPSSMTANEPPPPVDECLYSTVKNPQ